MTGIENTQGSQHCYFNMLLQCFSVNQTLFEELERHNVNHIIDQGKLMFTVSLLYKTSIRLSLSIAKLDVIGELMRRIHTKHTLRYLNDSCLYAHSTYYLDNFHKRWLLLHVH